MIKLHNDTKHLLKLEPYLGGKLIVSNITILNPDTTIQIASGGQRGVGVGKSGFYSEKVIADSIIVTFDNLFSIVHYTTEPFHKSLKYYLYSTVRNISNMESYTFKEINESSNIQSEYYNYTFTEQDYLDAK
jgi:hypothetical protein